MNKEIPKQKFQIGDTVYMIDDDYRFFEAIVTHIRLITFGKKAGTIKYTADCDFTDKDIEDWDNSISSDVTKEDIEDLQKIFDRILARNPSLNIAYEPDKLIEIDIN